MGGSTQGTNVYDRNAGERFEHTNDNQGVNQYGVDFQKLSRKRVALDSARAKQQFSGIAGNFIWCQNSSAAGAECFISFKHEEDESLLKVSRGFFLAGVKFPKVFVTNTAQSGQYVDIVYGEVDPRQLRIENIGEVFSTIEDILNIQNVEIVEQVLDVVQPNGARHPDKVTLVSGISDTLSAYAEDKRSMVIRTKTDAAGLVWIGGDESIEDEQGVPLYPGDSISIDGRAQISGYQNTGVDVDVYIFHTYEGII